MASLPFQVAGPVRLLIPIVKIALKVAILKWTRHPISLYGIEARGWETRQPAEDLRKGGEAMHLWIVFLPVWLGFTRKTRGK
jgi:hypothetical protein